jgi:5-formyltetrahydrofolate cyclo-ligase
MMHDADRAAAKADLRIMMVARRKSISEQSRRAMDGAIAAHCVALPEAVAAHHLHLYLSMPPLAEVNTEPIIAAFAAMQKRLSVPVVQHGELLSARYQPGDPVRFAAFGPPEPERFAAVDELDLALVLLPLLAFDGRGYRLGYGKGMYDRFLKRLAMQGVHPFRAGVAYRQQQLDELPVDPWDEPLDAIIHEDGIIRFASHAA